MVIRWMNTLFNPFAGIQGIWIDFYTFSRSVLSPNITWSIEYNLYAEVNVQSYLQTPNVCWSDKNNT